MFDTAIPDYNVVKATPFKQDIIERTGGCFAPNTVSNSIASHLDWAREDYPWGRTGRRLGRSNQETGRLIISS